MGDLATLPTFQPAPTGYTHADFNAVFAALTIANSAVTTNKLNDQSVTFQKFQNIATGTLLGRSTAGTGVVESITLGTNLAMAAGVLNLAAAINGVTIGATTPSTGAFTTLSAATSITGGTGAFTTLSAATSITGGTGAFTTLISTVADSTYGLRIAGTTGKIKFIGYASGSSYMEAVNAAENAYIPIQLSAATTTISNPTLGTQAVFSATGLAVTGTLSTTGDITLNKPTGSDAIVVINAATAQVPIFRLSINSVTKWGFIGEYPGVGTLSVYDYTSGANRAQFTATGFAVTGTGSFTGQCSALSFNSTSARRFKKNITPLRDAPGLLARLRPVSYDERAAYGRRGMVGFIAEELEADLPAMVSHDEDGRCSGINYAPLVSLAVAGYQHHEKRLTALEKILQGRN